MAICIKNSDVGVRQIVEEFSKTFKDFHKWKENYRFRICRLAIG